MSKPGRCFEGIISPTCRHTLASEIKASGMSIRPCVRPIAFHLPHFRPVPEDDGWWGKGFTQWTNVAKARSLFRGHYQPHLPAELGFYDLRMPEVRQAQADLARRTKAGRRTA